MTQEDRVSPGVQKAVQTFRQKAETRALHTLLDFKSDEAGAGVRPATAPGPMKHIPDNSVMEMVLAKMVQERLSLQNPRPPVLPTRPEPQPIPASQVLEVLDERYTHAVANSRTLPLEDLAEDVLRAAEGRRAGRPMDAQRTRQIVDHALQDTIVEMLRDQKIRDMVHTATLQRLQRLGFVSGKTPPTPHPTGMHAAAASGPEPIVESQQ